MAERELPVSDNFNSREDPAYLQFIENSFLATKETSVRNTASTDLILKRLNGLEPEAKVRSGVHTARSAHSHAKGGGRMIVLQNRKLPLSLTFIKGN